MTMESPCEIRIGERTYQIVRFKGMKAIIAGALMSRAMTEIPELQARVTEFRRDFRSRNTISITPAMAKLPRFRMLGLEREDFEAANGAIELPEEPDQNTILINVFPDLFKLARKEIMKFLGLIVIPNRELEDADESDEDLDAALMKAGKAILWEGDVDEILELIIVGAEVFKDQMASKRDRLGKLPIPILHQILNPPEEKEEKGNNGHGPSSETQTEEDPSLLPNSLEPSLEDSPPSTDGIDEPSSTEFLGTSSSS